MHRLLIFLLAGLTLYGMEEEPNTCDEDYFLMREEAEFDIHSQNELLVEQTMCMSLAETITWQMIPPEVIVYIFSFIPEEMKNLILINHECYNLTKEVYFLKAVALYIIDRNLEKAVNLYAQAFEDDNDNLVQALLDSNLREKVAPKETLENFSKESMLETKSGPIFTTVLIDNSKAFIKEIVKFFPQAARKIFIKAASKGDLSLITVCFDNNINIDLDHEYNSNGNNALIEAAHGGHIGVVQLLTDKGAGINFANSSNHTPLLAAIYNGHVKTIELLLNLDAEIIERDKEEITPFMVAVMLKHIEIIKLLVDRKPHLKDNPYNESNLTPLLVAAAGGYEESLIILLELGAKIDAIDNNKDNALHYASFYGHSNIAKILVEKDANINAKNKDGRTPLMYAVMAGSLEMVRVLLRLNADPNIQTKKYKKGKTALIYACKWGYLDIVKELLPISNINAQDEYGITAKELALSKIRKLKNFDNIEAQNYLRIIELLNQYATKEGKLTIVDRILQNIHDEYLGKWPEIAFIFTAGAVATFTLSKFIENKK